MSLPPFPEPYLYPRGDYFFNAEQMQAYGQQCREDALEEAAQVCESAITSIWDYHDDGRKQIGTTVCTNLAAGIRKIKEMK